MSSLFKALGAVLCHPMAAVTTETTILAGDLASFSLTGNNYQGLRLVSLT
jgi:hypothetical protein